MPFRRFGMGLAMISLGFVLGVWITMSFRQDFPAPIAHPSLAGGSATGNAIEVAKATIQIQDSLVSIPLPVVTDIPRAALTRPPDTLKSVLPPVLFGVSFHSKNPSFDGSGVDPDGDGLGLGSTRGPDPWEGRPDSLSKALSPTELRQWLQSRGLSYSRAFVIRNDAPLSESREGLEGPAFPDLANIPGGLQPGDLIVYRQGLYSSSTQIPSPRFRATPNRPLILLGWPGERVSLRIPANAEPDGASHWQIFGLEWNGNLRGSISFLFENCLIQTLQSKNAMNLILRGNLFEDSASIFLLQLSTGTLQLHANLFAESRLWIEGFDGDSIGIHSNLFHSPKLPLQLSKIHANTSIQGNVVLGKGHGCMFLDSISGDSLLLKNNSLWNRTGCAPDSCQSLLRLRSTSQNSSVLIQNNLMLDEAGSVLDSLSGRPEFKDNTLFARPQTPLLWLQDHNLLQDPGFLHAKQL